MVPFFFDSHLESPTQPISLLQSHAFTASPIFILQKVVTYGKLKVLVHFVQVCRQIWCLKSVTPTTYWVNRTCLIEVGKSKQ